MTRRSTQPLSTVAIWNSALLYKVMASILPYQPLPWIRNLEKHLGGRGDIFLMTQQTNQLATCIIGKADLSSEYPLPGEIIGNFTGFFPPRKCLCQNNSPIPSRRFAILCCTGRKLLHEATETANWGAPTLTKNNNNLPQAAFLHH